MEILNTPENKLLFDAQYINFEVDISETEYGKIEAHRLTTCKLLGIRLESTHSIGILQTNIVSQNNGYLYLNHDVYKLKLRGLQSIIDDEAIEVAKKHSAYIYKNDKEHAKIGRLFIANLFELNTWSGNTIIDIYQYLQSKGFALPWRGLSVEQQITYNWINLIEDVK